MRFDTQVKTVKKTSKRLSKITLAFILLLIQILFFVGNQNIRKLNAGVVVSSWTTDGVGAGTGTGDQFGPKIVSDNSGGVIVLWTDTRSGGFMVYGQRYNSSGVAQWTANGKALSPTSNGVNAAVADGSGGAFFVTQNNVFHIDSNGDHLWGASGVALFTPSGSACLDVINDGSGGIITTCNFTGADFSTDLRVQKVDSSGVRQWGNTGTNVGTTTGEADGQFEAHLVSDGSGGAVVEWDSSKTSSLPYLFDTRVQRVNSAGVVQWTAGGIILDLDSTYNSPEGKLVADGLGNFFVTWASSASVTGSPFLQKLNSSGVLQFAAPGIEIDPLGPGFTQRLMSAVSDGANGILISTGNIRRFDNNGNLIWTSSGGTIPTYIKMSIGNNKIFTSGHNTLFPGGDGSWEAYVAIYNLTTGEYESNGYLTNVSGNQTYAVPLADGNGGAYIAWDDTRAGNGDLYLQRITTAQQISSVPGGYEVRRGNGDNIAAPSSYGETSSNIEVVAINPGTYNFPSFKVNVDMSADRNWGSFQYVASTSNYYAYSVGIQSLPGLVGGSYTMYVPRRTIDDYIIVCPNTTNIVDIISTCAGGQTYIPTDPNITATTIGGVDVWEISGLTDSVGIKSTREPTTVTDHFSITPDPVTGIEGANANFTLTARNIDNSVNDIYVGTVTFSSDAVDATLPSNYTFTEADAGIVNLSALFPTQGSYTLTATDTVNSSANASAAVNIFVSQGKPLSLLSNFDFRIDGDGDNFCLACWDTVLAVGDINGDTLDDIVMHGYENGGNDDIIYVVFGSSTPRTQITSLTDSSSYNIRIEPDTINDGFYVYGIKIEDVNNDGFGDLIISSTDSSYTNSYSGSVVVIYSTILDNYAGTGNVMVLDDPNSFSFRIDGNTNEAIGGSDGIPIIKDFNQDSVKDFIVPSYSGVVYFIDSDHFLTFGNTTGNIIDLANPNNYEHRIYTASNNMGRATELANTILVDDVTGDGQIDYLFGDNSLNTYRGGIYFIDSSIIQGWTGTGNNIDLDVTTNYTALFQNSLFDTYTYLSTIFAGDVNSDGVKDVLMDSQTGAEAGIYVLFSTLLDSIAGTGNSIDLSNTSNYNLRLLTDLGSTSARLGPISIGTDWNNDTHPDIVLTGINDTYAGVNSVVYILFSTLIQTIGTSTGNDWDLSNSNYSVLIAGAEPNQSLHSNGSYKPMDWDNDSLPDMLLSAEKSDFNGLDSGSVYIISGDKISTSSVPAELSLADGNNYILRLDGPDAGIEFNNWGASLQGDFNGDNTNDLILGNANTSFSAPYSGSIYIILGEAPVIPSYNIINLSNPLTPRLASDYNTDLSVTGFTGAQSVRLYASTIPIADIGANLTQDLDWATVNADSDSGLRKSFVHDLTTAPGADSNFSLYVPKEATDDRIYICPDATNLTEVTTSCSNGYELTDADTNVSIFTYQTNDYWKIDNLSGTGGISYQYIAPPSGYNILNLSNPLTVRLASDNSVDLSVTKLTGSQNVKLFKSAIPLADITVGLTQDRDWSGITADSSSISKKAYVHNLTTAPGAGTYYSLYVPKAGSDNRAYVCPNATNFTEITTNCTNGYSVADSDAGVSIVTYLSNDYWKIDNLSGTGVLSYEYVAPQPDPGNGGGGGSQTSGGTSGGTTTVTEPTPTTLDPATTDSDNDGLTNAQEQQLGTNPNDADSDNDGLLDGEEYNGCVYLPGTTTCSSTFFVPTNPNDPKSYYIPPTSSVTPVGVTPTETTTPIAENTNSQPSIIESIANVVSSVTSGVVDVAQKTLDVPLTAVKTTAQSGALPTALVVGSTTTTALTAVSYPNFITYAFFWIKKRKRNTTWGIIYDSTDNKPIAFATVRLLTETSSFVTQTVSDLNGKYSLTIPTGNYLLTVKINGYKQLNQNISNNGADQTFNNDLGLTPLGSNKVNYVKKIKENLTKINSIVFYVGLVFAFLTVVYAPSIVNTVILAIFILQVVLLFISKPRKGGEIFDQQTREKIKGVFIRVYDQASGRQVGSVVTDNNGKYNIMLQPGKYLVKAESLNYEISSVFTNSKDALGTPYVALELTKEERLSLKIPMRRKTTTSQVAGKFGF